MNRFWRDSWTVFGKELLDALRDRRSLISALAFPLLGPLLITVMFGTLARTQRTDKPLKVSVVGAEHAPSLIGFLERNAVELLDPPDDPQAAIRDGDVDVVLEITEGFPEAFRASRPAVVRMIIDSSRQASSTPVRRTVELLRTYNSQIAGLRLLAHGVSPGIVRPLDVERIDVASREKRAARLALSVVPMFLILAAFIAGINVAIDTTAGERERRSLEPLLVNPVSRLAIALGKWGTTSLFGLVGVTLTTLVSLIALRAASLEDLGIQMTISGGKILALVAIAAPVALLAGGLQMLVATFARSYKEAQTYVAILPFTAMMPTILLQFQPLDTAAWMMAVPAMAQQQLLMDALGGEVQWGLTALAGGALLVYALIAVWITAAMLRRERIIFGH